MASVDAFLAPIPAPSPSGIDLRNDERFHALERLLLPARRSVRAQAPDSEPQVDWADVLRQCEDLAGDGRDLRLLVIAVRAMAQTEGLAGVAEGLGLLTRTVEDYWPTLHPELRDNASPREAAVRRINALYQLENEDDGLLCDLSHMVLFSLRGLGRFTSADLAAGSLTRGGFLAEQPSGLGETERAALAAQHEARVERVRTGGRALAAEAPSRLAALSEGVAAARAALAGLEGSLSARIGENGAGVRFTRLDRFFERLAATLATAAPDDRPQPAAVGGAEAASTSDAFPIASAAAGPITSRADVERALDRIIEFYDRTEPASPIPLIVRRLRRMVPMTFLQLMEEMAPSGLKEVRNLAGVADEKTKTKGGADGG